MPSHTRAERRKRRIPKGRRARAKIRKVLGEFKRRKLRSSSGAKVTSRAQAIAIALSEARRRQRQRA